MDPIAHSPLAKKQEQDSATMTFGEALIKTTEGSKITKLEWQNTEIYGYLKDRVELRLHRDGRDHIWIINDGDILGRDWVIV